MSFLTIGGVVIPVAPGGGRVDWLDAVDRQRAFDNSYRASATGNPKRDFSFNTPPLSRDLGEVYKRVLATVTPQTCLGDALGGSNNLALYSEQFDHATWQKTAGVTVTANDSIDPVGGQTSDTIHGFAGASNAVFQNLGVNPAGSAYAFSDWLAGSGTLTLRITNNVDQSFDQLVTLTGTWTRYFVAGTFNATAGTLFAYLYSLAGNTATQANVWGAQVNAGTAPTPYVRTTSAVSPDTTSVSCFSELTNLEPIGPGGRLVSLSFLLHEA